MILKATAAYKLFAARFAEARALIEAAGYTKNDLKAILLAYDRYVDWALGYLAEKIIVFKYHFNRLWSEAYYFPWKSSRRARAHNTANGYVTTTLRGIGIEKGWLQ